MAQSQNQKPIFVATHPRACSTAFERVFMTQRDTIQCIHEPFGDAFYYGPERLSDRYEADEAGREASGFAHSTFKTILDRIEREGRENEGKRIFIKDILHYLLPPHSKKASIAPSLHRIKRGVGTESEETLASKAVGNGVNGVDANGHSTGGEKKSSNGEAVAGKKGGKAPYPYSTPSEPGNPTVMPKELLQDFHFAFLIRDPHYSVPSYYRCTIPPLDSVTGFSYYDPAEAGYDEMRRFFEYLRRERMIGPHVATREQDASDILALANGNGSNGSAVSHQKPVGKPGAQVGVEICVVDADEMLDSPAAMMEAFCRSVGIDYTPEMLNWDSEGAHGYAKEAFEKWKGFHNDAIDSKGLTARKHPRAPKSEEQFDAEWREKYGEEGAALIRKTVDANMADYLFLKQFAMKV
ncbi:P-loop containing nucleoside triphosphate hydrolase protein [Aspergillus pseudoustus]|uniref:P-loop containing nucleoside triphosphate hydrolase protein n=1 Tax=Aspergillus pseudoustus TaxID=1810923 RepID=A0ABR4JFR8_9EURO